MKIWLTITHRDAGITDSFDMSMYTWHEVLIDALMFPTFNYEWNLSVEFPLELNLTQSNKDYLVSLANSNVAISEIVALAEELSRINSSKQG